MFTLEEIEAKCQDNLWLKRGGADFADGWLEESEYPYGVYNCKSLEELETKLGSGGWSIRSCFTYNRLAFVNQVNGGDEWWVLYRHDDNRLESFESVTFRRIIDDGEFKEYFARLAEGPDIYWERGDITEEV